MTSERKTLVLNLNSIPLPFQKTPASTAPMADSEMEPLMQLKQLVLTLSVASAALLSQQLYAQQASPDSKPTTTSRSQVKIERDEFIKSHRWDPVIDDWALKPEFEPPAGIKDRNQIRKERDDFLKKNRWDSTMNQWIPLEKPRLISSLSREQVRRETREFMRTHVWDTSLEIWSPKRTRK